MILQLDPFIPVLVIEGYGWPAGKGVTLIYSDSRNQAFPSSSPENTGPASPS